MHARKSVYARVCMQEREKEREERQPQDQPRLCSARHQPHLWPSFIL